MNTGAFDPAQDICTRAHEQGAWVHVDGAFGLWAAVSPRYAPLVTGVQNADSWAIDCHKWLNVPYDSGIVVVRHPEHLRRALSSGSAAYLTPSAEREPWHYTPEASRRARAVELWVAIRSLGRSGLCAMVERNCHQAQLFASRLRSAGFAVLNDVVLNQVLVSFGSPEATRSVIADLQSEGTCWCGGTVWQGHTAMRISVSSWATTDEDVERSAEAMIRIARNVLVGQIERRQRNIRLGTLEELPSRSAARKQLSELLKNAPPKTEMSFQELAERWGNAEGSTIKATTLHHYKNALRAYVLPKFAERKITEINREDIQNFLAEKARKYSESTLRSMRVVLGLTLGWANNCGRSKRIPAVA